MDGVKDSRQQLFSTATGTAAPGRPVPHRQRAFSLHDMLVTLTVAATLLAVGVPSLKQLISRQRMSTAINGLITALHSTRSEAIKRGRRAVLCPSADGLRCQGAGANGTWWHAGFLLYIDHNANHERDDDEPVVRVFDATPGLHIHTPRSRAHITYLPNGLAYGANTTFIFCAEHADSPARSVVVANSGRPRVAPPDEVATCPGAPA